MTLWDSLFVTAAVAIVLLKVYRLSMAGVYESRRLLDHFVAANPEGDSEIADGLTRGWDEVWLVFVALVACGPFGLLLMWIGGNWNSGLKLKITIWYLAVLFEIVTLMFSLWPD